MNYVSNNEILSELREYQTTKVVSNKLCEIFYLIARNLTKKGNWVGYTYKEDMVQEAVYTCVRYIKNFDVEKGNNAFAYITIICNRAFIAYIKKQKKHSMIKDSCYQDLDALRDQKRTWSEKAIDYTVLSKDL